MGSNILSQAVVLSDGMSSYVNLNTLLGAVVVLAIIVLIMLITYFVTIKPNLNTTSEKEVSSNYVGNTITQTPQKEQEELISDCELVAVITAAIYASMGDAVPADGFVVRSIRKANSKKWINA